MLLILNILHYRKQNESILVTDLKIFDFTIFNYKTL